MSAAVVMPLIFVAAILLNLAIAARTGRIYYGRGFNMNALYVEHSKRPRIFWLLVAFHVAVASMAAAVVLR